MTRAETIAKIAANAEKLNDDQLDGLAAFTSTLVQPRAISTLSPAGKAALDRLDRGEGIPGEEVFARLDARIAVAKAGAGEPGFSTGRPRPIFKPGSTT